jgi:uncharacterized protein (DUF58 family)
MFSPTVLRRSRLVLLKARRAVATLLGGAYRSVFKGVGLAFEEVRPYQPGDDIRAIDWNVTARMGHPFIKRFVEERELIVLLAVDLSRSLAFGTGQQEKREVAAELGAFLALVALRNNDRLGLVLFTDRVEHFLPPRKGPRHVLRLIHDVLCFPATGAGTSIAAALRYVQRVLRRRALVVLLSDFLDEGYDRLFKQVGRRHDVIAVRVHDPRERELPSVGFVRLQDAETGRVLTIDTRPRSAAAALAEAARARAESLAQRMKAARVDYLDVGTDSDHLAALIRFLRLRERPRP